MRIGVVGVSLVFLLTAGCSAASERGASPGPVGEKNRPPDLLVASGDDQLVLSPFTYCWSSGGQGVCADGAPPDPLPSFTVEPGEHLRVEFPLDWRLQATLFAGEDYCEGSFTIDIDTNGAPIETSGPAGTHRVEIFGRGEGGDGAWAVELTTAEDQPAPPPYVQMLWFPGGRDLDPGASFSAQVGNLITRPEDVSGVATVTSSGGGSEVFDLTANLDQDCWGSVVGFEGPDNMTARVLELGPAPYEVSLTVNLGDQQIESPELTWPDDFPANSDESARKAVHPER